MFYYLHRVYSFFLSYIRSNRIICYLLFSVWYNNKNFGEYWDWVTLEFRKVIKNNLKYNYKFLDMGTGPYGILSFYALQFDRKNKIVGCDYENKLIKNINKNTISNRKISFIESNLFQNISGNFDLIVFNAPYIDLKFGEKIGVITDNLSRKRWSGGTKGIETIDRFLSEVGFYLKDNGICALGVNNFYISDNLVKKIIIKNNLILFQNSKNSFTMANIYLIKKRIL